MIVLMVNFSSCCKPVMRLMLLICDLCFLSEFFFFELVILNNFVSLFMYQKNYDPNFTCSKRRERNSLMFFTTLACDACLV